MKYDVAVIGAGAAGLAASRALAGAGRNVVVLEARDRVGGRIHTLHRADLPVPIELGAEFIHGEPEETFRIVDAAALTAYELPDKHLWNGEEKSHFWDDVNAVRARIKPGRDRSFADFLRHAKLDDERRAMMLNFVEGYHAAHVDRISALSLRASDAEQEGDTKQFRIANGYDALIDAMRSDAELRLGAVVSVVRWSAGRVEIDARTRRVEETIRARAAIVTIPIGVWKAAGDQPGAIRFTPELNDKQRAVAKLEVGHVVKIVFRVRERFWDDALSFFHCDDRFMPTWWTQAPVRSPLLTGWAGGHAADAMLAEGSEAIVDRAMDSLAKMMRMRRRDIERRLVAAYTHDWQADAFSRGAYSYAGVGGSGAHKALARPIQGTLFFAGEATNGQQTGTVAGAIASGRRAARELLSS